MIALMAAATALSPAVITDDRVLLPLRIDCEVTSVRETGGSEEKSNLVFLFSRPLKTQTDVQVVQSLSDGRNWLGHASITDMASGHWPNFRALLAMPWGAPAFIEAKLDLANAATYTSMSHLPDGGGSVSASGVCVMREEAEDRQEAAQ